MRGQEDRRPLRAQIADKLSYVLHALRVETAGGLVQDDDVRFVDQSQRDPQPLTHTVRVAAHLGAAAVGKSHLLQDLGHPRLGDLAVHLPQHAQVPAGGHVVVEHGVVHEAAEVTQSVGAICGHLVVEHLDVPGAGIDEAEYQPDSGGLPAAVRAQEAVDIASAHRDVEIVDRPKLLEILGKAVSG